jgi:DNA-directed RNA polymerase subunit RPC12/RpoP
MYDEAGRMSARGRRAPVVRTVTIDLNTLLKQIKNGGIVAVYRCPYCGANLKVDKGTTRKSLRKCTHCGSEIEAMALADFLKSTLS